MTPPTPDLPVSDQVSLVVATKNEVEGMRAIMPRLEGVGYDELIVVDAGSTDGTLDYCRERGYRVIQQSRRGLPNALDEVFPHTTKGIVVTFSPDGNSIPERVPDLVAKIREGYDMVICSRYLGDATSEDDDMFTSQGNSMFTAAVNLLFGCSYTDTLVMFRAYRREAIERMGLTRMDNNRFRHWFWYMNSWELGSAVRAAVLGLRVAEVPGDEPKRIGGERKLSIIKNGSGVLAQIIYERLHARRLRSEGRGR